MSELTIDRLSKWDHLDGKLVGQLGRSNNDSNKNRKETGLDWQNNGFTHASRLFCTFISLPSLHNNDVKLPYFTFWGQCAKKVVSHSLGLVDFAIGLVCSVFKLPDGQLKFFGEIKSQRTVIKPAHHATGSWNDFWAITCKLQFAQMASCKTPFLFTLVEEVSTRQRLSNSFLNHDTVL